MSIKIGSYELYRRTDYSKLVILDKNKNNISSSTIGKEIADKIINDYTNQTKYTNEYFNINGDELDNCNKKTDIEYLFIPEDVRYIHRSVFKHSKIKLIYFPNSLFSIGAEAFGQCRCLEEITLPSSLCVIGEGAFFGCSSLKRIKLPERIELLTSSLFSGCENLKELVLPNSIKIIGSGSLAYCKSLEKINMPRDFENFGRYPFASSGITTIRFNYDLSDKKDPGIIYGGFLIDSNIHKIEISNKVSHIDPNFFEYSGGIIDEINYIGSKKDFRNFKKNNGMLFKILKNAKINLKEDLEELIKEEPKIETKNDIIFER